MQGRQSLDVDVHTSHLHAHARTCGARTHSRSLTCTPRVLHLNQGRYDVVCPFKTAWDLHRRFPEAKMVICGGSGHSSTEVEITDELVKACDAHRDIKLRNIGTPKQVCAVLCCVCVCVCVCVPL